MTTIPASATTFADKGVFDDAFLRKLARLEWVARKPLRGLLHGEHTTSRRGRGLEFSDFRQYRAGDDFRHIDWNVYSRLDQLFLKLHAADDDLTLHLLVDCSASMAFGEPPKFDHARRVAAALACIALNNLDRVAVSAFSGSIGADLSPVKGRRQMARVLAFLAGQRCGGTTGLAMVLRAFAARTRHPGVVVLISDLLGVPDVESGLDALRPGRHEVVVMQLLAEAEIDPPLDGALLMVDAETGDELTVTVDADLRALYQRHLDQRLQATERYCRRRGVEYLRASTAIAFEDIVLRYLRQGIHLR